MRALAFGLLDGDEARQAAADLNELVKKCGYHLNTGFLSTPNLTRARDGARSDCFRHIPDCTVPLLTVCPGLMMRKRWTWCAILQN